MPTGRKRERPPVAAYVSGLLDVMQGRVAHLPAASDGGGEPDLDRAVRSLSGILRHPAGETEARR